MAPGLVYLLLNPSIPGQIKVGRTRRTSEARAAELRTTGVPERFLVLYEVYVDDPARVEHQTHELLKSTRVSSDREFFRTSPKAAINALLDASASSRLSSPGAGNEVDIFESLRAQHGEILKPELFATAIRVTDDDVVLACSFQAGIADRTHTETSLSVIVDADDEPFFSVGLAAAENAERFLALDELTLIMITPIVSDSAAERINHEQNPYYTELWSSLDLPNSESDGRPPPF